MKGKRIISSLLSMAMVFTLNAGMSFAEEAPVTEEPVIEEQPVEEPAVVEEQPVIEEEPVLEEQPTQEEPAAETQEEEPEEEESEYPAQTFTGTTPDGTVNVKVSANEGALPEGTQMFVYNVSEEEIGGLIDSVISGIRKTVVAANIIFLDKDGNEIEPLTDVTITLENNVIEEFENASLVHINQANQIDVVSDTQILSFKEEKVVFTADVFSIYAVVDSGDTAEGEKRTTYKFQNYDGTPFEFRNNHGDLVDYQILKDGEELENVGFPDIDVVHNQKFLGWYFWNEDTQSFEGEAISFPKKMQVTETTTKIIRANIGTTYYLSFYENPDGSLPSEAMLTKKQVANNTTYDISNQTLPARENDLIFYGWSTEPFSGGDITTDTRERITDTVITVTGDQSFYPIFRQAHWLIFKSGPSGSGASYVPSQYVTYSDTTTEPVAPTMRGYRFAYWSTKEYTGNDFIANAEAESEKFDFYTAIDDSTTLYGYWIPDTVKYRVFYWKQNVTDNKDAAEDAKTYSFFKMEDHEATTGETVNTPTEATQKGGSGEYIGFEYNETKSDKSVTVAADGSSVINVYYDRQLVTMQFWKSTISYVSQIPDYDSNSWNNTSNAEKYTGLYGQPLKDATSGNNYTWPQGLWYYYNSSDSYTGMSYLGQFILPDDVRDSDRLVFKAFKIADSGKNTISFFLQNIDNDDYPIEPDASGSVSDGTWGFSEKYDGFEVAEYRQQSVWISGRWSGGRWIPGHYEWNEWTSTSDGQSVDNEYNMQIRYKRKTYTLHFLDPVTGVDLLDPVDVKYGAPLANYVPSETIPEDKIPAGKKWTGKWMADSAGQQEFKWSESYMPNADLNVYADWEDIWYWVKIDPNGGELLENQSTYTWKTYGDTSLQEYSEIQRNYVEKSSGTYGYHYDEFPEGSEYDPSLPNKAYYYEGGSGYKYEHGAYQLIGWYDVVDGQVTTPHDFTAGITDNVYIRAMWRRVGDYKLIYDPTDPDAGVTGPHQPSDSSVYADGSDAAVLESAGDVNGYRFEGWMYDGKLYKPSDIIQVNAALDDKDGNEDKKITLTAKYTSYDVIPVGTTHINWYSNKLDAAGLPIEGVDSYDLYSHKDEGIPYNEKVNIVDISKMVTGNEYKDYTFLGWAKTPETNTSPVLTEKDLFLKYENGQYYAKDKNDNWVEVEKVGADEVGEIEALYAIWQGKFKVYHSGVPGGNVEEININSETVKNGTFDLTKTNLTTNTLYGGYYLNMDLGASSPAYNGTNITWSNPQTTRGDQIVPKANETYYIKEVPVSYLKPFYEYTYNLDNEQGINNIYLMSAIDDCNYRMAGFMIDDYKDAKVYTGFTIKATNGSFNHRFTTQNMFTIDGYVSAFKASAYIGANSFRVTPCWVTADHMLVTGTGQYQITSPSSNKTIQKTSSEVASTITYKAN